MAERELLKKKYDLKAEVLKVGLHGYCDATSEEFLKTVSPKISVVSVEKDSVRESPFREVLKRLKECDSKLYRTDKDIDIVICAKEDEVLKMKAKDE